MLKQIPRWVLIGSVVLAFSAGFVNCVALLGFANNAVSHVTGTVTLAAEALAHADFLRFWHPALIVLAFFGGAVLSGFIIKSESLRFGRRYGVALTIESLLLFLATLLFTRRNFAGELAASAACGLQNAMVATYSGSVLRTTHLTGILSDLGAGFGSALRGVPADPLQLRIQSAIFSSFLVGSAFGALAFDRLRYLAFLLPATLLLLAGLAYFALSARARRFPALDQAPSPPLPQSE